MRDPAVRESLGDTAPAQPFSGQCALITGGASGIGLESAAQLGEAGVSRVAINGRSAARGADALAVLRRRCPQAEFVFFPGDIADWTTAQRIAAAVLDAFGRLDIFVGATGAAHAPKLFHETPAEEINPILNGFLIPPLHMTRAVLPAMRARKAGSIVLVASDAAKIATPGESVIGAAMAGIVMFVRTLAMEAKRDGIRVNALTPSIVADTQTHDRAKHRRATMRAALYMGLKQIDIADIQPPKINDSQVLINVEACGCRSRQWDGSTRRPKGPEAVGEPPSAPSLRSEVCRARSGAHRF